MEPVSLSFASLVERLHKLEVRSEDLLEHSIISDEVSRLRKLKAMITLGFSVLDRLSRTEVGQDGPVQALLATLMQSIIEADNALRKSSELWKIENFKTRIATLRRNKESLSQCVESLSHIIIKLYKFLKLSFMDTEGRVHASKETTPLSLNQAPKELGSQLKTSPTYDTFRDALDGAIAPQDNRAFRMPESRPVSLVRVARNIDQRDSQTGPDEVQCPRPPPKEKSKVQFNSWNASTALVKPNMDFLTQLPYVTEVVMEKEPEQKPWQQADHSPEQGQFDVSDSDYDQIPISSSDSAGYARSLSSFATDVTLGLHDTPEELASLFLEDAELSILLKIALQRKTAQAKFVSKFRTLLKTYGRELRLEAIHVKQDAAAQWVQANASQIATRLQKIWNEASNHDNQPRFNDFGIVEQKAARSVQIQDLLNTSTPSEVIQDQDEDDDQSDSSSEEEDPNMIANVPYVPLDALEGFLTSSDAFDSLRKALRRMVFLNPLRGIRELLINTFKSLSDSYTATLRIDWPIQAYVARELGYDPSLKHRDYLLDKVLTITGNASKAYADTAKAYIQWKWSGAKVNVLELVNALLRARHNGDTSPHIERDDCSVTFASKDSKSLLGQGTIDVKVTGAVEDLVQVAQQFAWLSASFRGHKEGQVSYSDISFTQIGTNAFELRRMELDMVKPSETSCWLPLFVNGIIARGFPVPPRPNHEKGIELPFEVMVSLAKVMYPISHRGRFYLKGFSNIMFPTAISPDRTSVQWHMDMPSGLKEYLSPGTLPHNEDCWAKTDNIEDLTSANRTFLGYIHTIEGHLGTNTEIALKSIRTTRASGAYDEDPAIAVEVNKIQTGTSGFGIWGVQATADILYPKGLYHTVEAGWYIDMLDIAKARPMIVYDHAEESRRAWLVPTLSVVLHMAHIWGRDKTDIGRLPVAKLDWDAGEAAYLAIKEHSKDNLRDSLETDKQYFVRDLIGRLLICLEKLMEEEAKARSEPRRSVSLGTSTKLYGWDLLGIAQGDGNIWRQQLNLEQDWRVLGKDLAVLFCQNIGELVRPASNVKLCAAADAARLRQDRLIAPIKSLRWLSNKRGQSADSDCLRLGNKVFWQSPGNSLFGNCVDCLPSSHRRVHECAKQAQQILKEDCPGQKAAAPPIEGAVGFGTRKLHKPRLLTPDSASLSQSQSSDTPPTSISASDLRNPLSTIDGKENQKPRRKFRKHRLFGALVDSFR